VSASAGLLIVAALASGFVGARVLERVRRRRALQGGGRLRRIAFPFTGEGLSEPALAAALRLARVEEATLMPVYLALVPLSLSVEVPLRGEAELALSLLEAIEQRAARAHVPVDARIERGRTVRHALRELLAHERFERMVVAAGTSAAGEGFAPEDVAWMLARVRAEVIVLRPARDEAQSEMRPPAASVGSSPRRPLASSDAAPRLFAARRAKGARLRAEADEAGSAKPSAT
jgi:hypothetical protein